MKFFDKLNQSLPPLEEREGGPNRYSYCLNNPLKYTDPSGYWHSGGVADFYSSGAWQTGPYRRTSDPDGRGGSYGGGGGSGFGAPGQGGNGTGLDGAYYDWYSGTYRSTSPGNSFIPVVNIIFSSIDGNATFRGFLLTGSRPWYTEDGQEALNRLIGNQNGQGGDKWYYGIPGVGPALESGDNLARGNYCAAAAAFGMALIDVATLGEGTAYKTAAKAGTNVVYQGFDAAGIVRYVGITERQAAVRFAEHQAATGTGRGLLQYRVIDGATGLSRIDARIWEQTLINDYGLGKNGGLLLNKVNSIAPKYWWQYGINP